MRHSKICRVCGKEYVPCNGSAMRSPDTINWQVVACSKECGAEYFARIAASRGTVAEEPQVTIAVDEVAMPVEVSEVQEDIIVPKKRSRASRVFDEIVVE